MKKLKGLNKILVIAVVLTMVMTTVVLATTCSYYSDGDHRKTAHAPEYYYNTYTETGAELNSDGYMERVIYTKRDTYRETRYSCACGYQYASDYTTISLGVIINTEWTGVILN